MYSSKSWDSNPHVFNYSGWVTSHLKWHFCLYQVVIRFPPIPQTPGDPDETLLTLLTLVAHHAANFEIRRTNGGRGTKRLRRAQLRRHGLGLQDMARPAGVEGFYAPFFWRNLTATNSCFSSWGFTMQKRTVRAAQSKNGVWSREQRRPYSEPRLRVAMYTGLEINRMWMAQLSR